MAWRYAAMVGATIAIGIVLLVASGENRKRTALMSRGEMWNAQESSLSLQANEDLASSSRVGNSQVKLGGKVSENSLNGLGGAVLMLEFELTGSDLDRVADLEKNLVRIKKEALGAKSGFARDLKDVQKSSLKITALKEKALKIKMRIRSLQNKIATTQKKSHQELLKSIDDKDMVDSERETLSTELAKRTLHNMQEKYKARDQAMEKETNAQVLKEKQAEDDAKKLASKNNV
ncbi:hypothetical protein GUITHDRAFT_100355 [Guillardia theta CCMP2712]|uniref:Uncharacterized protein n=1 Tax=Guillardia theta (strain CCMP2712) TaxID=905079 RepID=L1K148_GUITC|nr:hypothetical protein GUITHDRAFT_100355 [Guillardia theta CCMP2712]EKX54108.1 hypothetical protein GUITHDRAFT_100355 [Guillardia theta CCMP2712]|eukprot:XP_005841088.1 hypothetical protein GUITHDRAFT_100355 [Guillardia theta CCMP2712]